MKILICNAGSTSLKFKLWRMPGAVALNEARIERIGLEDAIFTYTGATQKTRTVEPIQDYAQGIERFLKMMLSDGAVGMLQEIDAVGFKTVLAKGFLGDHMIDEAVKDGMRAYMTVAPAHNKPYLDAIAVFERVMPGVPLVGAFETAFHRTIPEYRRRYAIPNEWHERYGIEKMGYHGASHSYVAMRTRGAKRVISCHLGGSSSICAILDGQSVDNSFGFSLQEGIPHNNRVGEMDSFVWPFLLRQGLTLDELETGLTTAAGLKGVSGTTGDMRDLERAMDAGDADAKLAFEMMADAVRRTIGAYTVELGGLNELVFTGGIGERSARLRQAVCEGLGCLGVTLDRERNAGVDGEATVSGEDGLVTVKVIPANEELMVLERVCAVLASSAAAVPPA